MRFLEQPKSHDGFSVLGALILLSSLLGTTPKSSAWAHSTVQMSPKTVAGAPIGELSFELCLADRDGRCFQYAEGKLREVVRGQVLVQKRVDLLAANQILKRIETDLENLPKSNSPCSSTIRYVKASVERARVCRELLNRRQIKIWKALLKELEIKAIE